MPIDLISNIQPAPGGAGLFPTHLDIYGAGGYQVQPTTAARDAIPALNRKQGMVVYVVADGNEYRLDAGLTTWSIAGGGGGGTLAGDVTGPAASNVVERLTGLAGVVSVPTAALTWGVSATPVITQAQQTGNVTAPSVFTVRTQAPFASATGANNVPGSLRVDLGTNTNAYAVSYPAVYMRWAGVDWFQFKNAGTTPTLFTKVAAGTTDVSIYTRDSNNFATFGDATNTPLSTIAASVRIDLAITGGARMQIAAGTTTSINPNLLFYVDAVAPVFGQSVKTSNVAPENLTIRPQQPWNNVATSGTNQKPGNLVLDSFGTAINASGQYGQLNLTADGATAFNVAHATGGLIYLTRGATPAVNSQPYMWFFSTSAGINGPSSISLSINGGAAQMVLSASTANFFGSLTTLIPPPGITWAAASLAPTISQTTHSTNSLPQNLTIRPQQPAPGASSTGANCKPGDLIIDMGTPGGAPAGTTWGNIKFNTGATTRATYSFDGTNLTMRLDLFTQTTVGAAGAASALPATPSAYAKVNVGGTDYVIPLYAPV